MKGMHFCGVSIEVYVMPFLYVYPEMAVFTSFHPGLPPIFA